MSFRLVPKSVTLNDFERRNGPYYVLFERIRYLPYALGKSGYLNCLQQKCSPEHLVLAIYHLRRYDIGKPSIGELNGKWVAKYSYFAPIEGYISETVQDRRQVSINQ